MGLFGNLFDSEKRHYHDAEKMRDQVLGLEETYAGKTDEELKETTALLKQKLDHGADLKKILPDAFAAAREASKRVIGEFPYPVQVLGGVLLHDGDIAEMKTGEGKTLTAVMPIYLNALEGKGAHVVTVNEYLAQRDAKWMGDIYRFLGLSVGCNLHTLTPQQKRDAYACDITYTTNSELGFDYLRDNMVMDKADRVQRGLHYAVLDEVDSILIDEARTPLIISGAGQALDNAYLQADKFAKSCKKDQDVEVFPDDHAVTLTDAGIKKAEKTFGIKNIYAMGNAELNHYISNALQANFLMEDGVDYIVEQDEIVLVDPFTGRKMEGREFSDGLHQAIQAKEGVGIKQETQTLATITYQNFFRLYDKLSGMTGTAKSEEQEFLETYNMRVYVIPTNRPMIRRDEPDAVYKTKKAKYGAIVDEVARIHETGEPVLVGTVSVNANETLSKMLNQRRIPHTVLNARDDENEAKIIAMAGQKGAVTVATNMAGRGTDIRLGEGCAELGGLAVIGTERHESKRIDDQLRGRSGRQGDPGWSRFYVSMEDDLIVRYASDESKEVIDRWLQGKGSDDHIRAIVDKTQERAAGLHFDARKNTLEYDNVLMQQRKIIYDQRDQVLDMDDIHDLLVSLVKQNTQAALQGYQNDPDKEHGKKELQNYLKSMGVEKNVDLDESSNALQEDITAAILSAYQKKTEDLDENIRKKMEKQMFLTTLDQQWIRHVDMMEHLKMSIRLRSYASIRPEDAYRDEGLERFNNMMANISEQTIETLLSVQVKEPEEERKN